MRNFVMRDNYDFTDSVKNPYTKKNKKQVKIRLDEDTINYFKALAEDKDLPYQSLINLYLRDCAQSHRDLSGSEIVCMFKASPHCACSLLQYAIA